MAINTFGVTPAVIAARLHSLAISTTTSPATDAIEDMIDESAADLDGECSAMGIDAATAVDSGGTESLYKQLRAALIYAVLDLVLVSRRRGSESADRPYKALYDEKIARIRARPQTVSSQSGVDVTVDLGSSTYAADIYVPGVVGKVLRGGL